LVVWGKDACRYPWPLIQALRDESVNRGRHVVDGGSGDNSHLLGAGRPGPADVRVAA